MEEVSTKAPIPQEKYDLAYRIIALASMNIILIILIIPGIIRKVRQLIERWRTQPLKYKWDVEPKLREYYKNVERLLTGFDSAEKDSNSKQRTGLFSELTVPDSSGDILAAFPDDFKREIPANIKLENMFKEKKDEIKLVKASQAENEI